MGVTAAVAGIALISTAFGAKNANDQKKAATSAADAQQTAIAGQIATQKNKDAQSDATQLVQTTQQNYQRAAGSQLGNASGTILTSPLGDTTPPNVGSKTLLGA